MGKFIIVVPNGLDSRSPVQPHVHSIKLSLLLEEASASKTPVCDMVYDALPTELLRTEITLGSLTLDDFP